MKNLKVLKFSEAAYFIINFLIYAEKEKEVLKKSIPFDLRNLRLKYIYMSKAHPVYRVIIISVSTKHL